MSSYLEKIIKRHSSHLQEKIANQLTYPKVILEVCNGRCLNEETLKAVESLDQILPIIDSEFRNLSEDLNNKSEEGLS